MSGFPRPVDALLTAPLELPATAAGHLTTHGGSTLDDGSGNITLPSAADITLFSGNAAVILAPLPGNVLSLGNGAGGNAAISAAHISATSVATSPPAVVTPAVPASGTAVTNTTGVDVMAYVAGGVFTGATEVGGVSTGLDNGGFYVANGETITLTYSTAPTWTWLAV